MNYCQLTIVNELLSMNYCQLAVVCCQLTFCPSPHNPTKGNNHLKHLSQAK
jgi:hypothetical protein